MKETLLANDQELEVSRDYAVVLNGGLVEEESVDLMQIRAYELIAHGNAAN